jgi:hypothetical protein
MGTFSLMTVNIKFIPAEAAQTKTQSKFARSRVKMGIITFQKLLAG